MIYLRSLNHHILILNSAEVVNDLLEKQARITSDRPFRNILDRLLVYTPHIWLTTIFILHAFSSGRDKNMGEYYAEMRTFIIWLNLFVQGLKPYSESWRQSRRAFHQSFKQDAMFKYQPIQTSKIYEFLRVLASPPSEEELLNYISTYAQGFFLLIFVIYYANSQ